jgi:hypothetical protein
MIPMPQANLQNTLVLRVLEGGTRDKQGRPRTSCVIVKPNVADVDDGQPRDSGDRSSTDSLPISENDALFLRCILQSQNDYGTKPPPELALPRSIGVVVDYDCVKRMMFTKMLRDDDNTDEGRARHRERTKSAIKRARTRLMHAKVIGCHDPFVFWTGRPVRGIKETQKNDPSLFDPPAAMLS